MTWPSRSESGGVALVEVCPENPRAALFALSSGTPREWRSNTGMRISIAAHVVLVLTVALLPLFTPVELPERPDYVRVLIYDPPPPPPPPLPKGSALGVVARTERRQSPTPALIEPKSPPTLAAPAEASPGPEAEAAGSPTGSEFGVPEGLEGGVEGGVVGGVPGGVLGGVVGGTGTGPVLDYEQGPRPIKITKPVYPHEAFVKKIEGTVVVEILIDTEGRVARARVLSSVPLLDAAAVRTVYEWLFTPAIKHGRPVPTLAHAPVTFRTL
jgi:protein TonB